VILLPTILMGMTFPCVTGILTRGLGRLGGSVGRYYAYNTMGAIGGSVLAGFFLIPHFGSQRTLSLGIGANILIAAIVLSMVRRERTRIFAAGFAVVAVALWFLPSWSAKVMHSGVSIYGQKFVGQGERSDLSSRFEGMEIPFSKEGISTTVAVAKDAHGNRALIVNGKTDASSTSFDLETMVKTAFIPMILHPAPERVAVIGLGSGVTVGVAGLFDGVSTIEVVELEPAVIEAARYFEGENFSILDDPRAAFHIDDGRSFVQGTGESYDIIISEPSNPWISGVSSLFTREFMVEAKNRLAPGGIFCMWIQGYRISPADMKMILRTFAAVYPDATLWQGSVFDYILIGWKDGPVQAGMVTIQDRVDRNPDLARARALYEDLTPDGLIDSFRLGPREIVEYSGPGPLNTDDLDILEFSAPRSLYRSDSIKVEEGIWKARYGVFPPFISR
jgi:spermidine synthase